MTKGVYLSEATRDVSFELGKINLIIAPTGSGKTYYTIEKIQKELAAKKLLLLSPFKANLNQLRKHKEYPTDTQFLHSLNGFSAGYMPEQYPFGLMTIQKFFNYISNNPIEEFSAWTSLDCVIIDEIDEIFKIQKYPNEKLLKNFINTILIECKNRYIIAISATGEETIKNKFKEKNINTIFFNEKLKELTDETLVEFFVDALETIENCVNQGGRVLYYNQSVRKNLRLKDELFDKGISAEVLFSFNNTNYEMTDQALKISNQIAKEGTVPNVNVLLINNANYRGLNILDETIKYCIIHTTNHDTQIQVRGRLRFNNVKVFHLDPEWKDNKESFKDIPEEFLNIKLDNKRKEDLAKATLLVSKGKVISWRALKSLLINCGYKIEDKRSGNKYYSIITL